MCIYCMNSYNITLICRLFTDFNFYSRKRPENMILASLWFGKTKPKITCYLEPLMNSLMHLESNGLQSHAFMHACIICIYINPIIQTFHNPGIKQNRHKFFLQNTDRSNSAVAEQGGGLPSESNCTLLHS